MQTIEITGKSVDEAKKSAATKLGVDVDSLNVTVLEETKGLFGKSTVRIRAEAKAAEAKLAKAPAKEKAAKAPAAPEVVEDIQESFDEPAPVEAAPAEASGGKKDAPRRGGRGRGRGGEKSEAAPAAEASAGSERSDSAEEGEAGGAAATEADAQQLSTLISDLLASADLEVTIKNTQANGRYVNVELDGRDVAHLVGKHGEVLNAMQYLVNIIAGRKFNNGVRATLDGNNYRTRREEALYKLASRVAEEVKARGEEAVLDALPAFERRIVHKSLSDYEGIQTYSEGEEPNRRVVIAPAD